jgi:hypothetical protein
MAQLIELGHAKLLVKDLDGQLVGNARLENEGSVTDAVANRAGKARTPSTRIKTPPCRAAARRGQSGVSAFASRLKGSLSARRVPFEISLARQSLRQRNGPERGG